MVAVNHQFKDNNVAENENIDGIEKRKKYMISQEIRIVRKLASNNENDRNKQLRKLKKWLRIRCLSSFEFQDEDFMRIWKGLYVCMWMSDKPLVQENLAEELGSLTECFTSFQYAIQFFCAFFKTMSFEWFGIDQWRMDKFSQLVRRMLRAIFKVLRKEKWSNEAIIEFSNQLYDVLIENKQIGLQMHFVDIYLEELSKVSCGQITGISVIELLKPFVNLIGIQKDFRMMAYIKKKIFLQLLWQSNEGREYSEKFNIWKEMGFPSRSIDDLEKMEDDDLENELKDAEELDVNSTVSKGLDPRAGNVDVYLPALPVNAELIIQEFEKFLYKPETSTKNRRFMNSIIEKYKIFKTGKFPLGVHTVYKPELESMSSLVNQKVKSLKKLDNELYGGTRQLKKINKHKRKRILNSLSLDDDINEDNYEEYLKKILRKEMPHFINEKRRQQKKRKRIENTVWVEEEIESPKKNKIDKENMVIEDNVSDMISKLCKKLKGAQTEKNRREHIEYSSGFEVEEITSKQINREKRTAMFGSDWDKPLMDGEIEYFMTSRSKISKLNEINKEFKNSKSDTLLPNPFSPKAIKKNTILGKSLKRAKSMEMKTFLDTPNSKKKVKIVLNRNMTQKPSEYIKQVRNSPQVPYDADRKPTKSLLKPNAMPSPINPFYKKKIGLILNDTF